MQQPSTKHEATFIIILLLKTKTKNIFFMTVETIRSNLNEKNKSNLDILITIMFERFYVKVIVPSVARSIFSNFCFLCIMMYLAIFTKGCKIPLMCPWPDRKPSHSCHVKVLINPITLTTFVVLVSNSHLTTQIYLLNYNYLQYGVTNGSSKLKNTIIFYSIIRNSDSYFQNLIDP